MLKSVTTKVTYKVPAWSQCNMTNGKDKCRFCVKNSAKGYTCALYNSVLTTCGTEVHKCRDCVKATAGFSIPVEDQAPQVDPKELIKATIAEYNKVRKQLLNQGYPAALVDRLATEYIIGGK